MAPQWNFLENSSTFFIVKPLTTPSREPNWLPWGLTMGTYHAIKFTIEWYTKKNWSRKAPQWNFLENGSTSLYCSH